VITLITVPLVLGALFAVIAKRLTLHLRPEIATPLATVLALSAALCSGLVLSVAAVLAAAQLGPLPAIGKWSAAALRNDSGMPLQLGLIAAPIVAACLASAALRASRSLRCLSLARRASAGMHPLSGNLVLLEQRTPIAYSVAGSGGRVVVSTGMFAALSAPERRVLLAHEAAHLRHRHHLYIHLVRLAAAANPLLRPVVNAVVVATERWADEDAAREVGDRGLVAQAVARAALAATRPVPQVALAATDHAVVERVRLLLAPPPARRTPIVVVAVTAALCCWATAGVITVWANDVVQMAEAVYLHH
jgi:hypothetical protein